MEEIKCKGTPAQVARRVLAVLAEDPDLNWHVNVAGAYPDDWQDHLLICGRLTPDIPDDQALVKIVVLRGDWPVVGHIEAEQLTGYVLVTAHKRGRKTERDTERGIVRSITEDFSAMKPVWEKVKAELVRHGFIAELSDLGYLDDSAPKQPRGKPGRPRNPHNEWANEQVNVYHRPPAEVYPEWFKRRKSEEKGYDPADPHDDFNHAIQPRKKA